MTFVSANIQLEVMNCWNCGCTFAIPTSTKTNMAFHEETLFCPKGCRLSLGEPAYKAKLASALRSEQFYRERAAENRERAERTQRKLNATRGVVTRTKNRIAKGVCPCCNRTFVNVARHMENKHPEYSTKEEPGQ